MGVSTDAILFFGADFGSIEEDEVPEAVEKMADDGEEEWWKSVGGEGKCPFEIVRHCSGDFTMYAVAVAGTVRRAYRGHPKEVDPFEMSSQTGGHRWAFKTFCDKIGVSVEPRWIMCSYWG